MSRDSMIRIKEAETEAERIVADAKKRAQKMLDDAEVSGRSLCEASESQSSAEMAEMLAAVREKAASSTEKVLNDAAGEADQLEEAIRMKRKIAEKIILRGLDAKCR